MIKWVKGLFKKKLKLGHNGKTDLLKGLLEKEFESVELTHFMDKDECFYKCKVLGEDLYWGIKVNKLTLVQASSLQEFFEMHMRDFNRAVKRKKKQSR